MRSLFQTLLALSLLGLASSVAFGQGKANFSGTWLFDKSKSEVPKRTGRGDATGEAREVSGKMVIEHQGATLKVTKTLDIEGQEKSQPHTYDTGGKETTNPAPRGGSIVSKASWEGEKLVIATKQTLKTQKGDVPVEKREVWSLSADGKTLTIDTKVKMARREQATKAVFNKQ